MVNFFFNLNRVKKVKLIVGIVFVIGLFLTFLPTDLSADSNVEVGDRVPNFVLEGADGNKYEQKQMKWKIIILVMGPRKTSDNNTKWAKMLQQTFTKSKDVKIFSVFDMRSIPFFISNNFVRKKVKEKQEKHLLTILMDWKQKVNKLLGADKDKTDIFVIGPDRILVSHQAGSYSEKKLSLFRGKIEDILCSDNSKKKKY